MKLLYILLYARYFSSFFNYLFVKNIGSSARNNDELTEGYDGWAKYYDRDVLSFGYKIPAIMTCLIGRHIPPDIGTMLDAGVGTGILGETLALMGYKDLVGIDMSQGMLEVAQKKDVHKKLLKMTLGE